MLPTLTSGLPELSQNIWERYGFRGNPFNTQALSASAESILPIAQVIVGRGMESSESQLLTKYLNTLLDKNFIYPYRRDGRNIRYRASEDVHIIRDVPASEQVALF